MAKAGDSTFNKVLKESGGYVLDNEFIKYIIASPLPEGLSYNIRLNEIRMQFGLLDKRLITRLHLYLYELATGRGFMTRNLKYVAFNGKVYVVRGKEPHHRADQYMCYHIMLDEIK